MNQVVAKSEIHEFSSQIDTVPDQAHKGDIYRTLELLSLPIKAIKKFIRCIQIVYCP
ncbi:hypothetical protein [Acinetobacter sp. ANC 4633]|uniref:hypothetical protein n=1 Tax=Acinetobacter sp. ANC 4633 TaxID=2529845 RepID=UPI0013F16257|nr:hypothetical protein [Acinetobacter sp. ANC 4633]